MVRVLSSVVCVRACVRVCVCACVCVCVCVRVEVKNIEWYMKFLLNVCITVASSVGCSQTTRGCRDQKGKGGERSSRGERFVRM